MRPSAADRETARGVEAVCRRDLDSRELREAIGAHLARRLETDAHCFGTIDPATLLVTDHVTQGIPPEAAAGAAHNEYAVDDVLKYAELARAPLPAGVLSEATGGDPARSHRYRALLPRIDARHELRAAFVVDGACWGAMSLYRHGRRPDFSPADVDLFRRLSVPVGAALRRAAHRPGPGTGGAPDQAGVLVLDRDLRLLTANPAGRRWLDDLAAPTAALPIAVLDVAARGSSAARGAHGRVRGRSGRWLSVQASPLPGQGQPATIAVLICPAPASEVTGIMQMAYGLTPRERAVLDHVIAGRPTREISGRLHITLSTVQDHLKAIFTKAGARSRGELVARMLDGAFDQAPPDVPPGDRMTR